MVEPTPFVISGVAMADHHEFSCKCVLFLFQENDYLSLIFHLYDSEHETDDGGDDADRPNSLEVALMRYHLSLLLRRANARTSAKHHIPQAKNIPYQPLLIKPIFSVLAHAEKTVFFKTSVPALNLY